MSDPNQPLPAIDPMFGLMFIAAEHLIPLFKVGTIDEALARKMAVSAIEAYQPETRADYVNVARTIAFSMAALVLLGKSVADDMSMAEKMRAASRASALNRSADQSERTMMQRRRHQKANPSAEQPDPVPQTPEFDAAEMQAAIAGIMSEYMAIRPPPITGAPETASTQPPAPKPLAASPIRPPAAIHYNHPGASQPPATPYRPGLSQNSAIQREAAQTALQHAGSRNPA